MKKYQQLLLAVIAIVSFSCLLIYRHEYNKLRYVLQVLDFFGTPGVPSPVPLFCNRNGSFNKVISGADSIPSWQRISNTLYIYSAYWEKTEEKEHVKAFAVGVLNENLSYGCYLVYDSNPKRKKGQFSFSGISLKNDASDNKISGKSRTNGFVFYCEAEGKGVTPVGVVFFKTSINESSQGFLPVIALQINLSLINSTGICILPAPISSFNRSTYLEFLSFHRILGVNNFIAYGGNDQHKLLSSVQEYFSNEIDLTVLHWNYPFYGDYELMKVMAENDCKTRAIGLFENVLVLEWNQFFVPRIVISISKILNELDMSKKVYKFQISTLLFCNEYADNKDLNSSVPHVFKKIKYAYPKVDILVPIYRPYRRTGHVYKVSRNIVAIQQYASCRDFKIKSGEKKVAKIDTSILQFQKKFLNSDLLRL